jgi:hypothetical protein
MATPNPNIIYRTDQTGSLTYAQLDGNFAYLSQSIAAITTPESASYASTASYVEVAQTASYFDGTVENASTASYVEVAQTASYYEETDPIFTSVSGTFVLTSSFDSFTSSYSTDSASFDTRITDLESFSSSLDATFATETELNSATSSLSSSFANEIDGLASADEQTIELDTINNVIRLKETVAAPDSGTRTFEGNVTITGSLNVLDSITGSLIQVTNIQGTGSLYLKPDGSDIAERQFEIYNTAPSDIHFKGSATHSFFGDDTNYLKIDDNAATVTIDSTNGLFIETDTTIFGDAEFSGSILVSGSIIPNVNGTSATSSFSLGSPTAAWKDIYVSDGTINFVNSAGQIQGTLGAGTNGTVITGSLTVLPKDTLAVDDFNQVVRLHKQQLVGYSFSLWNPYSQERNMGLYNTGYGTPFVLPWDRKVSSYYINNKIPTASVGDGVEPWVILPPPFNSGHGPGDVISIYNMTNSTSSLYKNSGSISVFSGWQGITNVDSSSMLIDGTFNTGTLLSGSWGNYKNVNAAYILSNPSLTGSVQIAPGQKATFELIVFSGNTSQNITRPSNSDLDNYFNENGYNLNQTNVNSTTVALYYLFKGIENL